MRTHCRVEQRREHRRTWRTRVQEDQLRFAIPNDTGEGCSQGESGEEPPVDLNDDEGQWELNREVGERGGEVSGADFSGEDLEGVTQVTESAADGVQDIECTQDTPRGRRCAYAAAKVLRVLKQVLDAGFSEEEKKMVLHRCFADDLIRGIDPELSTTVLKLRTVAATTVQSLRGALQNLRDTHIQGKTKVRNIVLTAAVSKGDSQRKICDALGASRYLVRKAFQRRAQVDETGENLWAGGERKRRSDALTPEVRGAVCSWWETETTVSPNKKDVKRRRISAKEHDTHATHYLQVSQVQFSHALKSLRFSLLSYYV